jgi:hypothetical protein
MRKQLERPPDVEEIRAEAIRAGALDPMGLRFRIIRRHRSSGEVVEIKAGNLGFRDAVETTIALSRHGGCFDFVLEPVEFVQ